MNKGITFSNNRFWIVMAEEPVLVARVRHHSREAAKAEALRLARINKGQIFYVAAVTGFAEFPAIPIIGWNELQKE